MANVGGVTSQPTETGQGDAPAARGLTKTQRNDALPGRQGCRPPDRWQMIDAHFDAHLDSSACISAGLLDDEPQISLWKRTEWTPVNRRGWDS